MFKAGLVMVVLAAAVLAWVHLWLDRRERQLSPVIYWAAVDPALLVAAAGLLCCAYGIAAALVRWWWRWRTGP